MYIIPQFKGEEKAKYLRKSQVDDPLLTVEEVLAKHEQMLDDWVERNQPDGGPIPAENVFREIGSGETISSRPAMKRLLRLIENPKIKAIMVTEPSRLTRGDLEDIGYLVKILRYTNTIVITLGYAFDLNDDRDRDQFERELMRGNEYLEYTKKIRLNGRIASVKNGYFIAQTPPYGYRKIAIKEGKRTVHTLEPHPEQAPIVKRIFEMYASGIGPTRICDMFEKEHIPSPAGTNVWSPNSFKSILTNVHYLGKVKWNQRPHQKSVEGGVVKVSRPHMDDYLIFDGKHEAIIDQDLWDKVQAITGSHPKNPKAKNLSNPLAGILYCGCGKAMTGRNYYYPDGRIRCSPRVLCGSRRICYNASALLSDVTDKIKQVLREVIEDFEIRIQSGEENNYEEYEAMINRMEKQLAALRQREIQQWEEKMKNNMPEHVFKALNAPTVAEIQDLEQALDKARETVPEPIDYQEKITTFRAALDGLSNPNIPVRELNMLLKACINRITYNREKPDGPKNTTVTTPISLDFDLKL